MQIRRGNIYAPIIEPDITKININSNRLPLLTASAQGIFPLGIVDCRLPLTMYLYNVLYSISTRVPDLDIGPPPKGPTPSHNYNTHSYTDTTITQFLMILYKPVTLDDALQPIGHATTM